MTERHYYDAFQANHYEILVCASQLRWGLASYESAGCLNQGTVILAQQNQQSQHGTAVWAAQRGQGGLNSQARIGSGLNTQAGYSGGYSTQTSYSGVQEVTTSTHSSFATSGFIGTTLFTTDIKVYPKYDAYRASANDSGSSRGGPEEETRVCIFYRQTSVYTPDHP